MNIVGADAKSSFPISGKGESKARGPPGEQVRGYIKVCCLLCANTQRLEAWEGSVGGERQGRGSVVGVTCRPGRLLPSDKITKLGWDHLTQKGPDLRSSSFLSSQTHVGIGSLESHYLRRQTQTQSPNLKTVAPGGQPRCSKGVKNKFKNTQFSSLHRVGRV